MEGLSDNVVLTSAATLQWTNSQGMVSKKVIYKTCQLRIVRDNLRRMFVEVSPIATKSTTASSPPLRMALERVAVHKKFMSEGKASIQFLNENCTIMLSNAPLASLAGFLRVLMVKISGATAKPAPGTVRERLMQMDRQHFDDISPVTNVEIDRIRKSSQSKATDTTPSPPTNKKRPRVIGEGAASSASSPRSAKVFKPSRLIEEPQQLNDEQKEVLQACLGGRNIFFTGNYNR